MVKEMFKQGFVYKNIYFKLLKEKHIRKFFVNQAKSNSFQLYTTTNKSVSLNALFALFKFFDSLILATPIVNVKAELTKEELLFDVMKRIQLKIALPCIPKHHEDLSVLYYYSPNRYSISIRARKRRSEPLRPSYW